MVLGNYPLEYFVAVTPVVNPQPTWRLYDALAIDAGVVCAVTVADPRVAAAEHRQDDGRNFVWFVNHWAEELAATPDGHLMDVRAATVETVELEPYAITVLERVAD